jgi:hypothetical protein
MSLFDRVKGGIIQEAGDAINGLLDRTVTTDKERLEQKQQLMNVFVGLFDKITTAKRDVLLEEAKGSWLQRNWRPMVMLGFAFIVMYAKFFAPAFGLPNAELESEFWNLLSLGIGGYIIGRSGEKIVSDVASNLDKIPRKRR